MKKPRKVAIEAARGLGTLSRNGVNKWVNDYETQITLAPAKNAIKKSVTSEEKRFCNRCDNEVAESELKEYRYQCFECDEDLYTIETHSKDTAQIHQCEDSSDKPTAESLTDHEMQVWLEKKGHKLYDPSIDNNTDMEELHKLGVSYGFEFNPDTYLWSK